MKKIFTLLLFSAFLFTNWPAELNAQTTELFSTEETGATSFVHETYTFNLSNSLKIEFGAGYGRTGDDRYIGTSSSPIAPGVVGSIMNSSNNFYIHSLWVYPSENGGNDPGGSGSVIFTGKLDGNPVFTHTISSGFSTNWDDANNGFTNIDFSSYNTLAIDELEVEVTGGFNYIALDDFEHAIALATTPTLSTTAASSISDNSATLGGNVTSNGGATISERGVVYSETATNGNPELLETGVTANTNGSGTGSFNESIGSLNPGVQYSFQAYATNSEGTSYGGVQTFTTNQLSQTITYNPLSVVTYGDADFTPGATASSGLTISYSSSNTNIATIVSGQIHIVGAGSCTIHADQAGNTAYAAAPRVSQSLTVNKSTPTITAWPSATEITYGQELSNATLTGGTPSVSGTFTYDNPSSTPNAGTPSVAVSFNPTDNANYNAVADNVNVTVAKAILTVNADDKTKQTGEENPVFTYKVTGFVNGDDESYIDQLPQANCIADKNSPADDYPITVSSGSDNNYTFNYVSGTLTVLVATSTQPNNNIEVSIWPNPTKGLLNISNLSANHIYEIYALTGAWVKSGQFNGSQIDITDLNKGVYFLIVGNNQFKIVKH